MTAETDALRLVPLEPTEAMLWRGFDAKGAMTGLRHIHLIYRAMLAAAPAVQPAAGREEIARIVLDAVFEGFEHGECEKEWEPDYGRELAEKATSRILSALSQPGPAPEGEAAPVSPDSDLLKEAVGLLREFAEAADSLDDETGDHDVIWEFPAALSITAGGLRKARAFLSKVEERVHD